MSYLQSPIWWGKWISTKTYSGTKDTKSTEGANTSISISSFKIKLEIAISSLIKLEVVTLRPTAASAIVFSQTNSTIQQWINRMPKFIPRTSRDPLLGFQRTKLHTESDPDPVRSHD
jgi:hypothetical protein